MPWRSASPQGVLSPAAFAVAVGAWPVTGTAARCRSTDTPKITVSAPMTARDRLLISHPFFLSSRLYETRSLSGIRQHHVAQFPTHPAMASDDLIQAVRILRRGKPARL